MERELIITVKKDDYDDNKINREIECIKGLFPYFESFETFTTCNEIFDLENHVIIDTSVKLKHIFNEGVRKNNSFVVGLN